MGPDPDEALHREGLVGTQGLVDPPDPEGHLPRAIDVVGVHVLRESVL